MPDRVAVPEQVAVPDRVAVPEQAAVPDRVAVPEQVAVPDRAAVPEQVAEFLAAVRRRIRAAWGLAAGERWVPVAAGVGLLLVLASRLVPWTWLEPAALIVGAGTLIVLTVGCVTLPVDVEAAARSADRGLASNDALSTSLQFAGLTGVFGDEIRARPAAATSGLPFR